MESVCLDAILAEFWVELSNVLAPYVPDLDMGIRHGWCFEDVGMRGLGSHGMIHGFFNTIPVLCCIALQAASSPLST